MAKKSKGLTHEEIEKLVLAEISLAEQYCDSKRARRQEAWERYYGKPLGNEVVGRSEFVTRETLDTIEWMMPYFCKQFASGDSKVDLEIKEQPPWVGKALMVKLQEDLQDGAPTLFVLLYQWIKDALISDTAYVKPYYNLDRDEVTIEFDELPSDNMQQLMSDEDVKVKNAEMIDHPQHGRIFVDVKARVTRTIKDLIAAENVPHWEFLTVKQAMDINDEHPKGQQTEVTLDYLKRINRVRSQDGKDFFKDLDELEDAAEGRTQGAESTLEEKASYMDKGDETAPSDPTTETGPRSPVKFVEWYTRLDVDKDGFLEDITCYMGNDKLLRWEKNRDGFVPFSALKAIIDPYKAHGISYADLLIEIQNLKTQIFRRILDNFDFQNAGRWRVSERGSVDVDALMNNAPGEIIFGEKDSVEDISPQPFDGRAMGLLEYIDTIKENRTGSTRYNQGADSNSLNKTASGIMAIQGAAMQRMELIARIFVETGIKDFYKKCAILCQKYMTKPFTTKIQGVEREVTPDMIQGRVIARVSMGVVAGVGIEEAQKIERILGMLVNINQQFPGLLSPEKIHNIARKYITSFGFRQFDDFIEDLQQYAENFEKGQQAQSETQQQMMQAQQQKDQFDMQHQTKELEQEGQLGMQELQQEDIDSQRDMMVALEKIDASREAAKINLLQPFLQGPRGQESRAQ